MSMTKPQVPKPNVPVEEAEKRRELRVPLRILKVDTGARGDVFFGYAVNISSTGLFIQTSNPKEVGTRVSLTLALPGTKERLSITAEVIWSRNFVGKEALSPGMGMKLVELDADVREKIEKFIDSAN